MNTNRVVVITGAAGGIGSELVDRFLGNGDTVIAADLNDGILEAWRVRWDSGGAMNPHLITAAADISSEESCETIAGVARQRTGRVNVLINCAGWFPFTPLERMTAAEWRQVIDINLTGTFLMTRALMPLMKAGGWGRIVNFGSGSVFQGTAGQAHYVAAKAGVLGLTRSLARELGQYSITVNLVTPGLTVTLAVRDTLPEPILQAQPARRALRREEVAQDLVGPVFFLASDDAAFITGQTLNVDGGLHLL